MYIRADRSWFKHLDFMVIDLVFEEIVFVLAYYLRHGTYFICNAKIYQEMAVALVVFHIIIVFFLENYRGILKRGHIKELKSVLKYNVVLFAGLMSYMMFRKTTGEYSRFTLVLFFVLDCMVMYIVHEGYKKYLLNKKINQRKLQRMLLVTDSSRAEKLVRRIRQNEFGVTRLTGIVLLDRKLSGGKIMDIPVVSDKENMYEYARIHVVDEVLVDADVVNIELLSKVLSIWELQFTLISNRF